MKKKNKKTDSLHTPCASQGFVYVSQFCLVHAGIVLSKQ